LDTGPQVANRKSKPPYSPVGYMLLFELTAVTTVSQVAVRLLQD